MSQSHPKRRSLLRVLAALPGLGLLPRITGDAVAAAVASQETSQGRDVLRELGVRTFINAGGTFTALTGSLMKPEVVAAIQVASKKFVRIDDLHEAVGARIAALIGCEAALVTSGLRLGPDARDRRLSHRRRSRQDAGLARHRRPEDRGRRPEVAPGQLRSCDPEHRRQARRGRDCRGTLERDQRPDRDAVLPQLVRPSRKVNHEEFVAIARAKGGPDLDRRGGRRSAGREPLEVYENGVRLVGFSGGKGLRGPQSSGLLLGPERSDQGRPAQHQPNGDTMAGPTR